MTEPTPPTEPNPGQPWSGQPAPPPYPGFAPYPAGQPGFTPQGAYGPPAPASKAMAITALVLAIVGFACVSAIAAIVLAIIVLVRSKDGRDHGKGMAIAALVIAPIWILVLLALVAGGLLLEPDRDSTGAITEEGSLRADSIAVGDCVKDAISGDNIYSVPAIPCGEPHRLEAYATFKIPGADYPGADEVLRQSEEVCTERFEAFVGTSYEESTYDVRYLYPLSTSWRADKSVTCFLETSTPTTGSLKGSQQ